MENKSDPLVKKKKQKAKTFTANFFEDGLDSLDFLNESLINNKGIIVLNKSKNCAEIADESTALLFEEPVKKVKKRHKRKSSMEEKQHAKTFTASCFEDGLDFLNDSLINNKGIKLYDKNGHTCIENYVDNTDLMPEEPVKKVKSPTKDEESFVKHIEKKQKRHKTKSTFEEHVNENISLQNGTNVKVLGDTIIKEKKKRSKHKSAFKEHDIVVQKDTSEEVVGENTSHKSKLASEKCVPNVTNVEHLGEELKKERKKRSKHKSAFTGHDNENIVIQNAENVEVEELIKKKKKHKREFSAIVQDEDTRTLVNIDSIQEDPVQKMKRHKRESPTLGQVKNNSVMNVNFTYEKPTKVKKHKYKLYSQTAVGESFVAQGYANLESANKKENKQKDKSTNFDCSDDSHKTQSDAGLQHIFDINMIKKEVEDVVQDNADEEFADFLRNSQLTNYSIKEENELMQTVIPFEDEDDELFWRGALIPISMSDLDLNEDPVEFEIPMLHSSEKLYQIHEVEREFLKSQGGSVKLGKFTKLEDSLLKRNYNEFTKRFHVNDPQILLGVGQTFRNNAVVSFLRAKHFYVRLGKDLTDRPLFNIYKRARLLFNPLKNEKKLDKTDVNRIKKAHSLMGSKWQKIGNIIDKSAETTRSAFLWHDKSINRGKWTAEEESQLISAIKTVSGVTDLSNTETDGIISWEKVANLVPTKNFHQCRLHWVENLSCKFKKTGWTRQDYGKLVSILRNECYVDDYEKVNWKEVQKCFGDISWQFLRKKWYHLTKKLRQLKTEDKVKTYKQMLDHYCVTYDIKTD